MPYSTASKVLANFAAKTPKISYKFNDVNEYTAEGKDAIKKTLENVAEKFYRP